MIAGVVFSDFNGVNINMHVASDGSRRWLTKEFLRVVFDYPFNQAKVKRVTGLVGEGNIEARKFDEHIGFKLEARLAGAHPTGDLLIYVMRREDCRFLRAPYAKQSIRADLLRAAA
jgi:RimJ/RimL family protein N-acetyltransferase